MLAAEDEDLDDSVLGELVDPLADEGADDELAAIESEIEIDEPPELAPDDELELDTGGALDEVPVAPEQGWGDDDSTLGLDEVDTARDLEAFTPLEDENLPDGPDEPLPELDLPEPDAGEEDDAGGFEGDRQPQGELPATSRFGDEPPPVAANPGWRELSPSIELEPCSALTLAEGTALAASTDLLWFARGELSPLRLEAGATRIHAVALVGEGREFALCSTSSGRLLRRGRSASAPEELRPPRPLPGARALREPLDLHQASGPDFRRVIARTQSGQLLASDDEGASYAKVSEHKTAALASSGAPIAALTESARLLLSRDGGRSFGEQALAGVAREVARSRGALLAAAGEVVVLGAEEIGVVVSCDGGRSFARITGTRGVSALTAIAEEGGERVFVALENEAYDRSVIVEIDPRTGSARSIAAIQGSTDPETSDRVRVARLSWDAEQGRLWAAGAFGIRVFAPPSLAL